MADDDDLSAARIVKRENTPPSQKEIQRLKDNYYAFGRPLTE